ncbi:MAG: efflux RND transporter periplasmic adaptor subunit [Acidobacteriota bacterium]
MHRNLIQLLALLILLFTLISAGCRKAASENVQANEPDAKADPNIIELSPDSARYAQFVETEVVEQLLTVPLRVTGRVVVNEERTVHVGALFEGRVEKVLVQLGDRVRQGQVLALMHTHEVHDARADNDKAHAELDMKNSQLAFAKSAYERAQRLYRAKAIAYREVEEAENALKAAEQEARRATAELERTVANLEHLGLNEKSGTYDDSVSITAPISGVIMSRDLTPGAAATPGTPAFTISNLASLWVVAEVGERYLASIKRGATVTIEVAAFPDTTFTGKVVRIGDQLSPQTRTVEVRCLVENQAGRLKPEMYATVNLNLGETAMAQMVSEQAVQEIDGQSVVFVSTGNHRFEKREVTTGRKQNGLVEITKGVEAGQKVVAQGSFLLKSEFLKSRFAEEE